MSVVDKQEERLNKKSVVKGTVNVISGDPPFKELNV